MREQQILWIEDDYFAIRGLMHQLENEGFNIEAATSALEAFQKAPGWESYDVILVDLIIPLTISDEPLPEKVKSWKKEKYVGIGILKWLKRELKVDCPVLMLSVVRDPIARFNLENLGLAGYLPKRGLMPSQIKTKVLEILETES